MSRDIPWGDSLLMGLEPLRRHVAVWRAAWARDRARPRPGRRNADELAFLPALLEITETPASPLGRGTALIVIALFGAMLTWACLGRVDIHATAQGRVIPMGRTKVVAPLESATVAAIKVSDGDRVEAGQVLVELNAAAPDADAKRATREYLEQVVTAARLRALLDGRDTLRPPEGVTVPPDLLANHLAALRQKAADHKATIEALIQERHQSEAKLRGAQADLVRLEQTVPLLEEQSRTKDEMARAGWQSRTDYLKAEQNAIDRRQELQGAIHKVAELKAALTNIDERARQSTAQFRAEAQTQLAEAEQKAASLAQERAKAADRLRLYTLVAPVAGMVQQLAVHAAGAVAAQGAPVLMIVPDGEGVAIEAALPNKDVGFVRVGQAVEIKVESFPFTRYGTVAGTVAVVSSDAMQTADADPTRKPAAAGDPASTGPSRDTMGALYSVRVKPLTAGIMVDGAEVALTPGMAVTAEIKTGRRRLIEYVLDPVLRYGAESFRER